MNIDVAFLPQQLEQNKLEDTLCIVLDIFRATTSIVTAIAHDCREIVPVMTIDEAKETAAEATSLLAGERHSLKIEGFDFGNCPFEFSLDKVENQRIVMTTTNGTIAIRATDQAAHTLIGSFLNAAAVSQKAASYQQDIMIVCAGTHGEFSLEDSLCAGYLVSLLEAANEKIELSDGAYGAKLLYQQSKDQLLAVAKRSRNGRRLVELRKEAEISYCLQQDVLTVVPEYREKRIFLPKN